MLFQFYFSIIRHSFGDIFLGGIEFNAWGRKQQPNHLIQTSMKDGECLSISSLSFHDRVRK